MSRLVIGVDPGQTTGVLAMLVEAGHIVKDSPIVVQIHHVDGAGVLELIGALFDRGHSEDVAPVLAVEHFVVSTRAARSSSSRAGLTTRNLIGELRYLNAVFISHPAVTVKKWAMDRRLDKSGLLASTQGMHHARDAARHALYAAKELNLIHDPLSTKAAIDVRT